MTVSQYNIKIEHISDSNYEIERLVYTHYRAGMAAIHTSVWDPLYQLGEYTQF